MRIILGLAMAMLSLPCGSATGPGVDFAGIAGVPIRIFDLKAADVTEAFREFMQTVPMTNDRRVPEALVDDTVASLAFARAVTPPETPAFFVAAYLNKTPLVAAPPSDRTRYLARYGEAVWPQQVCPVFISRSDDLPQLLSVATTLSPSWFDDVVGDASAFGQLFALTEASHCGFIARELVRPSVVAGPLEPSDLRPILEAVGDFEATAVSRATTHDPAGADTADVLYAARLLAMFLVERENPYTVMPGLIHEYRRIGMTRAHRELQRIRRSVRRARRAIRHGLPPGERHSWSALEAARNRAQGRGGPGADDPLADTLIADLGPAMRLLRGDSSVRVFPESADPGNGVANLVTLAGVGGP